MPLTVLRSAVLAFAGAWLLGAAGIALAQVARVIDSKGVSIVERPGQPPRILGAGERLDQRETISVTHDSWVMLEFTDQTRISLRPNTVFRLDTYRESQPGSMLFGLVKGGLRAITGLIGKRNPTGVRIQTATATIGVRGTEFDARLCEDDCAAEERARPTPPPLFGPVARVVELNRLAAASRSGATPRILVAGAGVYEGDGLATGQDSYLVVAFLDGSRITLAERSQIAVARYRFEETPRLGQAYFKLLRGQAVFQTGALAKISPDAFLFEGPLGIIRPLGTVAVINDAPACEGYAACQPCAYTMSCVQPTPPTEVATDSAGGTTPTTSGDSAQSSSDVSASGPRQVLDQAMTAGAAGADAGRTFDEIAGDGILRTGQMGANFLAGLSRTGGSAEKRDGTARRQASGFVSVLDGAVEVLRDGQPIRIEKGAYASIGADGRPRVVPGAVDMRSAPRPDLVKIDPKLFDGETKAVLAGLYVWVRDGAVTLDAKDKALEVPTGSAAVATTEKVELLDTVPNFLRFDQTPRPLQASGFVVDTFRALDGSIFGSCKVR